MKTDHDLNLNPDARGAEMRRDPQPGLAGLELIYAERVRQIEAKRRTLEHDQRVNARGELAHAGACYALLAGGQARALAMPGGVPDVQALSPLKQWPWPGAAWKPSNHRIKNLVRAGALIAAEIDRALALGERLEVETNGTDTTDGSDAGATAPETPNPKL